MRPATDRHPDCPDLHLDEVLAAYLDAAAQGQAPQRDELLASHPDLAPQLREFFTNRDQVDQLAATLRDLPWLRPYPRETGHFPRPVLSDYEILDQLGQGGMGVVYRATQRSLRRPVALKVLRPGTGAGNDRVRFQAEAAAVARLRHPNIIQIYEVGEERGVLFFSLELIEGGSLQQRLSGAPLAPAEAAGIVAVLARAVHFAHQNGVVHRDLKPGNVLLSAACGLASPPAKPQAARQPLSDCVLKIADFGLAKCLDGDSRQTQSGVILGTPSYMAPEQARGEGKHVGPLADVYALGAVLYECLTGRPPFEAPTRLETVLRVTAADPSPPRALQSSCPRDLETVCLKCLQKDPRKRYASADELADDLNRFLRGEPIVARPVPAWERVVKWARRRPAFAGLLAVSVLTLAGLVGLILGHNVYLRARVEQEVAAREDAWRDQHRIALRPMLEQAEAALRRGAPEEAETLAVRVQDRTGSDPVLAPLRQRADGLVQRARRLLDVRRAARLLFARRDEMLYHLNRRLFTGLDLPADLEAARTAARAALAPFGLADGAVRGIALDDCSSPAEAERVTRGCYEVLLLLADATARSDRGSPDAATDDPRPLRQALRFLEQANRLVPTTLVYQRRRTRYEARLGTAPAPATEARPAPGPLDSFLLGSEIWLEENNPGRALGHFRRALRGQPDLFWARFFLAVAHLKLGEAERARAELTICVGQRPDVVWAYLFRGFLNAESGAFEEAEADFDQAGRLATDPAARYVLKVNRGMLRLRQGQGESAVDELRQAATLLPNQFHAHLNLALAYRKQQRLEEAAQALDKAVRLAPSLALLYRERGLLSLQRGQRGAALRDFEQALQVEPRGPRAHEDHLERGLILYQDGRYEEAARACTEALRLRPTFAAAHRLHGEVLLKLKRSSEALTALDRAIEHGSATAEVLQARALTRLGLGDAAAAVEDYTRALALRPQDATLRAGRGWACLACEAPRLAERDFTIAIRLAPTSGDAYNGRGYARVCLGRPADAVADARTALRLGPQDSRLFYNAARIFAQAAVRQESGSGYRDEALEWLTRALDLLGEDRRVEFWRQCVRSDRALSSLRFSPGFARLAALYDRPKP
jgi:tetratricopeptide (TPR) repeat protein